MTLMKEDVVRTRLQMSLAVCDRVARASTLVEARQVKRKEKWRLRMIQPAT